MEFSFTPEPAPGAASKAYRGYEYITSGDRPNDPDLIYAKTYGTVPIVYDAKNPTVSGLNFRNRVFEKNPVRLMFQLIGIFAVIEALVMAFFLAALTPAILKARKAAS